MVMLTFLALHDLVVLCTTRACPASSWSAGSPAFVDTCQLYVYNSHFRRSGKARTLPSAFATLLCTYRYSSDIDLERFIVVVIPSIMAFMT